MVAEPDGAADDGVPLLGCWPADELERGPAGGDAVWRCGELVRTSANAVAPAAITASAAAPIIAARGRRDCCDPEEPGGSAGAGTAGAGTAGAGSAGAGSGSGAVGGPVKTRLAACLPTDEITGLYRCLLEDTIALAQSLDGVAAAIMCPASDVEELRRMVDGKIQVVAQGGAGLAQALESVFEQFSAEGPRRMIAFNSDTPHLPADALQQAFDALASCDVVVGPTHDGGYYLVGATAAHPGLFTATAMGTASALEMLLMRARELGLTVRSVDEFYDIDLPDDLSRLEAELRLSPERAPRTAAWLRERARAVGSGDV